LTGSPGNLYLSIRKLSRNTMNFATVINNNGTDARQGAGCRRPAMTGQLADWGVRFPPVILTLTPQLMAGIPAG